MFYPYYYKNLWTLSRKKAGNAKNEVSVEVSAVCGVYSAVSVVYSAIRRVYYTVCRVYSATRRVYSAVSVVYSVIRRVYSAVCRVYSATRRVYYTASVEGTTASVELYRVVENSRKRLKMAKTGHFYPLLAN